MSIAPENPMRGLGMQPLIDRLAGRQKHRSIQGVQFGPGQVAADEKSGMIAPVNAG